MAVGAMPYVGGGEAVTVQLRDAWAGTALAGTWVDNTRPLYSDVLVAGKIRCGMAPEGSAVQVWAVSTDDYETRALLAVLPAASGRERYVAPVSVADAFGGKLPTRFGIEVVHNEVDLEPETDIRMVPVVRGDEEDDEVREVLAEYGPSFQ